MGKIPVWLQKQAATIVYFLIQRPTETRLRPRTTFFQTSIAKKSKPPLSAAALRRTSKMGLVYPF
jgi:hypothetical protein